MSAECFEPFARTCRACMYKQEYENVGQNPLPQMHSIPLHSIFENVMNNEPTRLVDILNSTTPPLHILEMDELPKTVCNNCLQQLLVLHQFQQMCLRSDQKMRKLLEVQLRPLQESNTPLTEDPLPNSYLKQEIGEENWEPLAVEQTEANTLVKSECNNEVHIVDEPTESTKPTKPTKSLRKASKCKQKQAETQIKQDCFGKRASLRSQRTRQAGSEHICKLCKENFSTNQSLLEHKRNVHADESLKDAKQSSGIHKSYVCEYCQKCKTMLRVI